MPLATTTQPRQATMSALPAFKQPAIKWWARFPFMPDYLMGDLSGRYVRNRDALSRLRVEKKAAGRLPWEPDPFVARPTAPPANVVRSPNAFRGPDIANSPGGRAIAAAGRGVAGGVSALVQLLSPASATAAQPAAQIPAAGLAARGAVGTAIRGMDKAEALRVASTLDLIEKAAIVRKRKGKYVLLTRDGKRTLGTHASAQDAYKQEYAIEKSKERAHEKTAAGNSITALLGVLGALGGGATGYFYGDPRDPTRTKIMRALGGAAIGGGTGALLGAGIRDVDRHGLFGHKPQRVRPISKDTQTATGDIAAALIPDKPDVVKNINALAADMASGDTTAQETYDAHYDRIPEEYREGVRKYVANGGSLDTAVEVYDNLLEQFRDPSRYSVPLTIDQKTLPIIKTMLGDDVLGRMLPVGGQEGILARGSPAQVLSDIEQGNNRVSMSITKQQWLDALGSAPARYRGLASQIVHPALRRPPPRPGDPGYKEFLVQQGREQARQWRLNNEAKLEAERTSAGNAALANEFLARELGAGGGAT